MSPRATGRKFGPLDVRCPTCGSHPGQPCTYLGPTDRTTGNHAHRQAAAHRATAAADPARCHRCGRPWTAHAQRHQAQT